MVTAGADNLAVLPRTAEVKTSSDLKASEVGLIPQDWVCRSVGEVADLLTGHPFPSSKFTQYGIRLLRGSNVKRGEIDWSEGIVAHWSEDAGGFSKFRLRPGDVIIAMDGSLVGRSFATLDASDVPSLLVQRVARLRSSVVEQGLLGYWICNPWFTQHCDALKTNTAVPHISPRDIRSYNIAFPPKRSEQEAIILALREADELIVTLERLIGKKRLIKQGAMQELLSGRRRLPGFSGEWLTKALLEIADIRSGGTPSTSNPDFWNGEVPWCTPTDITALGHGKYIVNTMKKISESGLLKSSAELIPEQSIIMTSRATIGDCAINKTPVATNQGFKNLVPRNGIDTEFLYYLMQTQKERLLALCGGSTFLEIGKRQLAKLMVKLPKVSEEQKAIGQTLADMDAELEALETRLEKARQIKQGMMQELLTGRVRLV